MDNKTPVYHNTPGEFRVGELPDHAYFIPHRAAFEGERRREESEYFHSLCGSWAFRYRASISEAEPFYEVGYDLSDFASIPVPSCWQTEGYDIPQYSTSPYPFLFNPPYVPARNPCGEYVRDFEFDPHHGRRYELHFEGKDSCIYLWLNGSFVGYGEVPHSDSAYDITSLLRPGKNRLCVRVLKWCKGSYLDDQDKIRMSGIFREVYILERDPEGIRNFNITADSDGRFILKVDSSLPVSISLYAPSGRRVLSANVKDCLDTQIDSPLLWSAESPALYELRMECGDEFIKTYIGFRRVEIVDAVFRINGQPVKIYGVNRHDSHPDKGYAVSYEDVKADLIMMKQYNINAVRTSHYPNSPYFYELCDRLGLYVIAEADMECHGCTYTDRFDAVVGDPVFRDMIVDRVVRMIRSLSNFPSIVIWSLGNESSWGDNLKAAAEAAKAIDISRPYHLESTVNAYKGAKYELDDSEEIRSCLDMYSYMYPSLNRLRNFYSSAERRQPILLCEYSHAMGNSCGDLAEYDEIFQSDDRYMGGCIWEWCDHGITLPQPDGGSYFGYGGDFGDILNFGNLCMDGLVRPNRHPNSSLYEAAAVFAPIRVKAVEGMKNTYEVTNRNSFTSLSNYLISYTVEVEGKTTEEGILAVDTPPLSKSRFSLNIKTEPIGNCYLSFSIRTKADSLWAKANHPIALIQLPLSEEVRSVPYDKKGRLTVTEKNSVIAISGEDFEYNFDRDIGMISRISRAGRELLSAPLALCCYRAPTDNDNSKTSDKNMAIFWQNDSKFGNIEHAYFEPIGIETFFTEGGFSIQSDFIFAVPGRKHICRGNQRLTVRADGSVDFDYSFDINQALPYFLPRLGLVLRLGVPGDIEYFGRGPHENYPDKSTSATVGRYPYIPDAEAYERPQESGNRSRVRSLRIEYGQGSALVFDGLFDFSASRFDLHKIARARHLHELCETEELRLHIDAFMSGVGSASCGGNPPSPSNRINAGDVLKLKFTMKTV